MIEMTKTEADFRKALLLDLPKALNLRPGGDGPNGEWRILDRVLEAHETIAGDRDDLLKAAAHAVKVLRKQDAVPAISRSLHNAISKAIARGKE